MSMYNGMMETLHTQLTQLLMDNGASVSKQSIDELCKFIFRRDEQICDRLLKETQRLRNDTQVSDLASLDLVEASRSGESAKEQQ